MRNKNSVFIKEQNTSHWNTALLPPHVCKLNTGINYFMAYAQLYLYCIYTYNTCRYLLYLIVYNTCTYKWTYNMCTYILQM